MITYAAPVKTLRNAGCETPVGKQPISIQHGSMNL